MTNGKFQMTNESLISKPKFGFWILVFIWILVLGFCHSAHAALSANDIIKKVDTNMTFGTSRFESRMIIHIRDQVRVKKITSYSRGRADSFSEFTYPARDKGVKYLKIEDNMWMYLPSVEKIIKIAGHMLRQSMMGSDFSYEDALESSKLMEKYSAKFVKEETITVPYMKGTKEIKANYDCYVIDLVAKVKKVTYYRRRIWADKKTFIPVKQALYAKSGKMLKIQALGDIRKFGDRYYPVYFTMSNLLRKDSRTEMFVDKAEFDLNIPDAIFTQRNLRK